MDGILKWLAGSKIDGRRVTNSEARVLRSAGCPEWLVAAGEAFPVVGTSWAIGEQVDLLWMEPRGMLAELEVDYGDMLDLRGKGLWPFGDCATGSGNPYFVDGDGNLHRLYHDDLEIVKVGKLTDLSIQA